MKTLFLILFLTSLNFGQYYVVDEIKQYQPTVGGVLTPTVSDTLPAMWSSYARVIDSITFFVDDSVTVQGKFGEYGYGTNLFSSAQLITGYSTISSFNESTIPASELLQFYFTALGDGINVVRWRIFWH